MVMGSNGWLSVFEPEYGARERVTNLRNIQRSFGSNSLITCDTIMRRNPMET